ncbi:MAG TPA: cytidylate kinase-like family protein [Geobacteraceae bacterium]|nr:cytidylate kinase-like family protein [Geobacteraceae bacterium]
MHQNVIIAISRQLGSGGSLIGRQVADRLGVKYIDREILHQAAELLHESENILSEREERLSSFWERVARAFCYGVPEAGYVPPPLRPIPDGELFFAESTIIRKLTENCSAVLVGRAGFYVLRDKPNLASVLLHAPSEIRIRRVMELYSIDDALQAAEIVDDADQQRAKFVKVMTGADWTDARNYHLCINTAKTGFDKATEMIMSLAEKTRKNSSP